MATIAERLKLGLEKRDMKQADLVRITGIGKSSISTYLTGSYEPKQKNIYKIAKALNVSEAWLMGADVPMERFSAPDDCGFPSPNAVSRGDVVTFPIVTTIAAHYDAISGDESLTEDVIDIPVQALGGRNKRDFCAMKVKGDSMFPDYREGDVVLVLLQNTMNYSGQIGVIAYGDGEMTLKRINFVMGEDWLELLPLNPQYPPKRIEGADLEQCKVIGIPKLLIRKL